MSDKTLISFAPNVRSLPYDEGCLAAGGTTWNLLHWASLEGTAATGSGTWATDTLFAVPFIAPPLPCKAVLVEAFVSTLLAGSTIHVGLYENVADPNDLYPGTLLFDSGALDSASTGSKHATCDVTLKPGHTYWLVLSTSSSVTLALRQFGVTQQILGVDPADWSIEYTHITVASAYGALPSTFPGSGAYGTSNVPGLRCQFGKGIL